MKSLFNLILPIAAALLTASAGHINAAEATEGSAKVELCAPCHGAAGVSRFAEVPHLAGQQRDYLIAEMKAFRRATDKNAPTRHWNSRREPIMDHQTLALTDADIDNLAFHFAAQACATPSGTGAAAMPKLAQRCVSCHGANGRSRTATVPHLAGQQRPYLENQLRAFRDAGDSAGPGGKRRERLHPMMNRQAETLADEDIRGLAGYFAAQPCQ